MVSIKEINLFNSNLDELARFLDERSRIDEDKLPQVREIIRMVRHEGDKALLKFSQDFDGVDLSKQGFLVSDEEIKKALKVAEASFIDIFQEARKRIEDFACYETKCLKNWEYKDDLGNTLGQVFKPIRRVGFYIPGGRAFYPSTILMNIIPARVAGVEEIVVCTPPRPDGSIIPEILVASSLLEIKEIYRLGGAQAIAALAYGTESIKPVDLIAGPGNIYVTLAKREVYGKVGIDLLAGPSEIVVLADNTANPKFIAADLLAQAEHDPDARCALISDSLDLINKVKGEINAQIIKLTTQKVAKKSLETNGLLVYVSDLEVGIRAVNLFAPEHLEVIVASPEGVVDKIYACGAIFVGANSTVVAGDYLAGPSHTLPTSQTARFFSPLSVQTFLTSHSLIKLSHDGFLKMAPKMVEFAQLEGLEAHAEAVKVRLDELNNEL